MFQKRQPSTMHYTSTASPLSVLVTAGLFSREVNPPPSHLRGLIPVMWVMCVWCVGCTHFICMCSGLEIMKTCKWRPGGHTYWWITMLLLMTSWMHPSFESWAQWILPSCLCSLFERNIISKILSKGGKNMTNLLLWVMAGCVLLLHVLNKLRQTWFPPPASKELSAIPFISPENTGLYTRVKPCVPEEKQDQSPSPLCVVIKPTAGSSHYAIRVSMQTWSMAPQALLLTSPPAASPSSAPVHCKEGQTALQPTVWWLWECLLWNTLV